MKQVISNHAINVPGILVKVALVLGESAPTCSSPSLQSSCTGEAWRTNSRVSSNCKAWKLPPAKRGRYLAATEFGRATPTVEPPKKRLESRGLKSCWDIRTDGKTPLHCNFSIWYPLSGKLFCTSDASLLKTPGPTMPPSSSNTFSPSSTHKFAVCHDYRIHCSFPSNSVKRRKPNHTPSARISLGMTDIQIRHWCGEPNHNLSQ